MRRRREKRTDYYLRRRLIVSRKPRLVVRPSSKHMTAQIIEASPASDITMVSSHSSELESLGWKGSTGNLPAAYLTGLLLGIRAGSKGIGEAVLDLGVKKPKAGSRIYAVLKGAIDGGLTVPHGEGIFPGDDRIKGEHIAGCGALLAASDEVSYHSRFSKLLSLGARPEGLPELFESVRSTIMQSEKKA